MLPLSPEKSLFELTIHRTAPKFIPSEGTAENSRRVYKKRKLVVGGNIFMSCRD